MRIICLIKYVPDTEQFEYDYETDKINREKSRMILNPDDRNAVAWALNQKKQETSIYVEVVSMGPASTAEELKNLVRLGADHATLISDRQFAGSDSLATSVILSEYLRSKDFDILLTGTHTLDGGTGHVGPQVAECLEIDQFSNIRSIEAMTKDHSIVEAVHEEKTLRVKLQNPCVLGLTSQMNLRLGFVRYENIDKNVDTHFTLVTNETLNLSEEEVGRKGSPTKVRKTRVAKREKQESKVVQVDEQGIEEVVRFLQEKGYIACSRH
ncbi:electron transfer flavoprotein subunit beta [Enterococcus florum]|uniref:Electron transfer flavoprotein small subunit n=1 Tax=Enterococcus florum TaxID=2480627 RepID=A0A4P5P9W5_9ENTE|nr:electron transfer flavoprotein subunit beta/FixA family protein [Enterococcus florum]GCF94877.1 electron transfer flavoprotein subunit beta [Enterococcus florum]